MRNAGVALVALIAAGAGFAAGVAFEASRAGEGRPVAVDASATMPPPAMKPAVEPVEAPRAEPPAAPLVAPPATPVAETPDPWRVTEDRSEMDDSPRVVLATVAEIRRNRYGAPSRPTLIIRCQERETELYIATDEYLGLETTEVTARIDDDKPASSTWGISTDNKAMFARGALGLIRKLAGKTSYTVRVTPYGENPITLKFDVRQLDKHLPKVAQACGWTL